MTLRQLLALIFGRRPAPIPIPPVEPPRPTPTEPTPLPGSAPLINLVNDRRAALGLRHLESNPALVQAAADHAADMHDRRFFNHRGSDGSTWMDRARRRGYPDGVAEVIASGQRSADEAVASWMGSPGHRAILMDKNARHFGGAVAGTSWVALVGG